MNHGRPAKLLRIHISESDHYGGKPLYEAIVAKCRESEIAGATVFRGLEGFGESGEMHRAHLLHRDEPIVITIVDTPEKVASIVPLIEPMIDTGLIAVSDATMLRVQKNP